MLLHRFVAICHLLDNDSNRSRSMRTESTCFTATHIVRAMVAITRAPILVNRVTVDSLLTPHSMPSNVVPTAHRIKVKNMRVTASSIESCGRSGNGGGLSACATPELRDRTIDWTLCTPSARRHCGQSMTCHLHSRSLICSHNDILKSSVFSGVTVHSSAYLHTHRLNNA